MPTVRKLEDLTAWTLARQLVSEIYDYTRNPSVKRDFGYCDQVQRAAVSAMSNIAEGFERRSDREFAQFLNMSLASASEVRSLLYVGHDVGYLSEGEFRRIMSLCRETIRTTSKLQSYLRQSSRTAKSNRLQ